MSVEHIEAIGRMLAILVPVMSGLVWVVRRIERGQTRMIEKINRIDKHKVSYKACDARRSTCPYKTRKRKLS